MNIVLRRYRMRIYGTKKSNNEMETASFMKEKNRTIRQMVRFFDLTDRNFLNPRRNAKGISSKDLRASGSLFYSPTGAKMKSSRLPQEPELLVMCAPTVIVPSVVVISAMRGER